MYLKTQEFRRRKRWHGLDVIKSGGGSAPYAWTRFNTTSGASDFVTANEENKYPDKQTQNGFYYEKIAPYVVNVQTVSWQTGTDEQIAAMVAAADLGLINLKDYWNVGEYRTIQLSAMEATGVGETHAAQTATLVLMDKTCTGFTLANATSGGKNTPDFIVGLRNSLVETGYMNPTDTNEGGWAGCARRTWCNDVFRMAIPESIRGIFKQFKWKQRNGGKNSSGLVETIDYFGLAPEKVVLGYRTYGFADEAALYTQWEWYEIGRRRNKKLGDTGSANGWWKGSPYSGNNDDNDIGYGYIISGFCTNEIGGSEAGYQKADTYFGLSPFGCV